MKRPGYLSRRHALLGALALPLCRPALGAAPAGDFSLALLGQSLICHDLRKHPWPGLEALRTRLRRHDAVFSDLEVALRGPRAGAPTRVAETLHTADPVVLETLRDFGITFLATSNNHAFDIGTGGILDTIDAVRASGMAWAGSGISLREAAAPGYQQTPAGRLAVVAAAAGKVREGGAATASRPGVHELRGSASGGLDGGDVARMIESIRIAATQAEVVVAYLHSHLWEAAPEQTPDWQREFARRCVDAGAQAFVAHGTPLLQGIELYRGAPLFHGLGSFIFQTRKDEDAYGERNWQTLVVECRFRERRFAGAELVPVQLAAVGVGGALDLETRGRPSPASPAEAQRILGTVAELSARLGYRIEVKGPTALIGAG